SPKSTIDSLRSIAARIRPTAGPIFGNRNGSLSDLSRGLRKASTSSAQVKPLRERSRAMHSAPHISRHGMAPPFNSSRDGRLLRGIGKNERHIVLPEQLEKFRHQKRRMSNLQGIGERL